MGFGSVQIFSGLWDLLYPREELSELSSLDVHIVLIPKLIGANKIHQLAC